MLSVTIYFWVLYNDKTFELENFVVRVEIIICRKYFMVACLYTYIADQQSHKSEPNMFEILPIIPSSTS